jgi:hypothetical protein
MPKSVGNGRGNGSNANVMIVVATESCSEIPNHQTRMTVFIRDSDFVILS